MKRKLTDLETMRAQELLVQRATEGLDDDAVAELERFDAGESIGFDLAAAAVAVANVPREPMPAALAEQIAAAALRAATAGRSDPISAPTSSLSTAPAVPVVAADLAEPPRPARPRPAPRPRARLAIGIAATGWLAAAALAAVALTRAPARATDPGTAAAAPEAARRALLTRTSTAGAIAPRPCQPGGDPSGQAATGDVVWDPTGQRGYLRVVGLAPNDARTERYQIWIVDRARDPRFPIDGGRFDVPGPGELVVAIDARLPVADAEQFLVTVEAPGGAVVSDRHRLALRTR